MASQTASAGRAKAPPVPSMIPRASTLSNSNLSKSASLDASTLLLLKKELGEDAHLLDKIPLATTMVQDGQFDNCLPYKIRIGTISVDGAAWDAWAFLSSKLYREKDSTPRMLIYAASKNGIWQKFQSEHVNDDKGGHWTEPFGSIRTPDRRTLLVKTCFILKGVQLPEKTRFPQAFLYDLKAVCRTFEARARKSEAFDTAISQPAGIYTAPAIARKTQQHGPKAQLFSLSPATAPQIGREASRSKSALLPSRSPQSADRDAAVGITTSSQDVKARHSSKDNLPILNLNKPSVNARSSEPPTQPTKPANATTRLDVPVNSNFSPRISQSVSSFEAEQAPVKECSRSSAPASKDQIPGDGDQSHSASVKRRIIEDFDEFQERMIDIEEHLAELDLVEQETENKYKQQRRGKIRSIDVEMKQRHDEEMKKLDFEMKQIHEAETKKLHERQKAESTKAREEFDKLKKEHSETMNNLQQQREDMMKQKEVIREGIQRMQEQWTPDQMLKLLEEASRERARKRRKTWHSSDTTVTK